jgi:hypothetical protein
LNWRHLQGRARVIGSIAGLFVFLIGGGSIAGYYYGQSKKAVPVDTSPKVSNLTAEEIAKLSEVGSNLGGTNQTLNIGANALLRGKVDVGSDLSVAGRLSANGATTLAQLGVTGPAVVSSLAANSNLSVAGNTTLQQNLSVAGLATISGGLNVGGSTSVNSLNASSIAVRNIAISGPLTISHLATQGAVPTLVAGTAVGGGGTVNISGNDTAGTVTFNTGSAPPAGVLGTVTFRAAYTSSVHVLLSPITSGAAATAYYVTRTSGGFQVHANTAAPAGTSVSFDYLVTQ